MSVGTSDLVELDQSTAGLVGDSDALGNVLSASESLIVRPLFRWLEEVV
jgi:hypothetical protein